MTNNKLIFGGIVAAASIVLLADYKQKSNKTDTSISEKSCTNYSKSFNPQKKNKAKTYVKQIVKKIAEEGKDYKIGKTGDIKNRRKDYPSCGCFYPILKANDDSFINLLESEAISENYSNRNNINKKRGSAGTMTDKNGEYWLYVKQFC